MPFYLELEAQLHDRTPREQRLPAAFGGSHAEVNERLLGYLDASEQATMRTLSAFGSWDAALFDAAVTEFRTGYPALEAERFGSFWSIERLAPDRWQMHQELAENLQKDLAARDPERHKAVHAFGFEYFDSGLADKSVRDITVNDVEALGNALKHAWVIKGPDDLSEWFWSRVHVISEGAVWGPLIAVVQEYLARTESDLGPDHPSVGTALHKQAGLLQHLSRYEEAESLYSRALKIREAVYGPDNTDVAATLNNLAWLLGGLSRYEEAEPLYRRALAIQEAVYGPDHTDVAATLNNLAVLLQHLSRYVGAELLYRRALAIQEAAYGPDHPDVADTLHNLAWLLEGLSRYEEAEPLCRRALAIHEAVYGPEHRDVAATRNNLAVILMDLGQYKEAEALLRRSLEISEAVHGPVHPDVAGTLNNLARLLEATGRHEEATEFRKRLYL